MKNGTSVIYNKQHKAKIISVSVANGTARIKFDDPKLMPPRMDVPLKLIEEVPIGDHWHRWTSYVGFREKYRYCEICDEKDFSDQ